MKTFKNFHYYFSCNFVSLLSMVNIVSDAPNHAKNLNVFFCKCAKGLANSKSPIFKGALCLYGSDIQYMYCLNSNIDVVGGSH